MINGTIRSHDPSIGFYTGNGPIPTSYPSTFTTNPRQSTGLPFHHNQQGTNNSTANSNVYNFQNGATNSTDYYAQTRSNTPGAYSTANHQLKQSSTSATLNVPTEKTFLVVPGTNTNRKSPLIQVIQLIINRSIDFSFSLHQLLSLLYPHSNIDHQQIQ